MLTIFIQLQISLSVEFALKNSLLIPDEVIPQLVTHLLQNFLMKISPWLAVGMGRIRKSPGLLGTTLA